MRMTRTTMVVIAALALACKANDDRQGSKEQTAASPATPTPVELEGGASAGSGATREMIQPLQEEQKLDRTKRKVGKSTGRGDDADEPEPDVFKDGSKNEDPDDDGPGSEAETVTRAWFPETFLFEPLVVTDTGGNATVTVKVPDRLTTWRVLALAHSRTGAQGGAETSFLGTLPIYVDPIVPPILVVGDRVRLPIQIVNTTDAPITTKLTIAVEGASASGGTGSRTVPAAGSVVEYTTLTADRAGEIRLRVGIGSTDAVLRTIDVVPAGRPVTTLRNGTLAAPRELSIDGPPGADPATGRVRLMVFPGALAILRSELGVSVRRTGIADDAYALLLAGRATALLGALGDEPDPDALRTLAIVTAQRAIRHGRNLDVVGASLLAEAALSHADNPVMVRLGERAAAYLAQNQRPDGTFGGGDGWSLQRVLVTTADAARAVATTSEHAEAAAKQRAAGVAIRASSAFERNIEHVPDAYTAAAILASGAARGELVNVLRARVIAALKKADDGSMYLDPEAGVVRADGTTPSRADATALAVLGLAGDPKAPRADLGATVLGSYTLAYGWGDGRTNLACMRAVVDLFSTPIASDIAVSLKLDGTVVGGATLSRDRIREVSVIEIDKLPSIAGTHAWTITAEPAVPGLGYSLAIDTWVPWTKDPARAGLDLAFPSAIAGKVGKPIDLPLTAIAPAGLPLHLRVALPAGVQLDVPSLDALVTSGTIASYDVADGVVDLRAAPLAPGTTFAARVRAIPTLGGTLRSGASLVEAGTHSMQIPPVVWTIE